MHDFIAKLPKAELHVHLEGTLQPEAELRLTKGNGIVLEQHTAEEFRASYDFTDLQSFLATFNGGVATLVEEQDYFDLTWDYLSLAREGSRGCRRRASSTGGINPTENAEVGCVWCPSGSPELVPIGSQQSAFLSPRWWTACCPPGHQPGGL